jgi:hypothetical protein
MTELCATASPSWYETPTLNFDAAKADIIQRTFL